MRLIPNLVMYASLFVGSAVAADLPPKLHDGLAIASPAAAGLNPIPLSQLSAAIARGDYPKTTSILIVRDGRLVYEAYFNEGNRDLLNNTRSATKFITTLAVGAAIHDRAIPSERALAFPYLADLRPFQNDTPEKNAITLEDMMTMSSALDCDDNDDNSPGNEDKMHPQPNWARWAADLPTMPGYSRDASNLGPWRYCTANAFLVGQVVQRASHTPVDRYIEKKVLRPLSIEKWNWSYSPAREIMTGGGLELRSRDLAKLGWMLVNDGRWKNRQVVEKNWIDTALTVRRASRPDQNYGYFIFEGSYKTTCGPHPIWYMAGTGGNQILLLRDLHAAIVVTRQAYNMHGSSLQTQDLLEKYVVPALYCVTAH